MAFLESSITNPYLRATALALISFTFLAIVILVLEKILVKLTSKTKTTLDDKLFERTWRPILILLAVVSVRFSFNDLPLSAFSKQIELNILNSVVAISIAFVLYSVVDVILMYSLNGLSNRRKNKVYESLSSLIHGVLSISLIIITFLYILDLWGVEIGPLLAGLGIAGLAVALALQPTLSNIFSGVSIILDKSARIGDWLILENGTWGTIHKIGLRSTKVKSFDNELLVIPNSKLADSIIHNVALPEPKTRVVVPFGVAYGSDVDKVKKIVMKEIESLPGLISKEDASVKFLEMADSSLNFKAYFYIDSFENRLSTIDEITTKIYNTLRKNKIEIPFPQIDVHMKK